MKYLILFTVTFLTLQTFAWNKVGNGGDVLVCNENSPTERVELLDAYEAKTIYNLDPHVNDQLTDVTEMALDLVSRLKNVAPARSQMLEVYIKNFQSEARFVTNQLEDIPDHGFINIPKNCKIKQLVINSCKNENDSFFLFSNDSVSGINQSNLNSWNKICSGRYTINQNLWNKLDLKQKAMTITHEAFMRDYRHMGDPSFTFDGPFHPVRYLNILTFSNKVSQYNYKSFQKLYGSIGRINEVREDELGYLELKKADGPKRPYVKNNEIYWETSTEVTVVPFINATFYNYLFGYLSGLEVRFTKSTFHYFNDEINFTTDSIIEMKKNNYSFETIKVTGNIKARRSVIIEHTPLAIDHIYNYDTKGTEKIDTGFSELSYCEKDDFQPPIVIETYYTKYESTLYPVVSYTNLKSFYVKNSYLDIEVLADSRIVEYPHKKQFNCDINNNKAGAMIVKARGKVKLNNQWIDINDKEIYINIEDSSVEIYN